MGNLVNAPIFFESQLSSIFTVFLIGMSLVGIVPSKRVGQ